LLLALLTIASFTPTTAAAESSAAEPAAPAHRLVWRYPSFRWWEYAAAGAVSVGNITLEVAYQSKHHPAERWSEPILADSIMRGWLRARSPEGRKLADDVSDYQWHWSTAYVLADGLVTPLVSDRFNTKVAYQLTLLNGQTIGLAGLVARLTHVNVGRTRPMLLGCSHEPGTEFPCKFEGASFLAGHTLMSSANAGLACANHRYLPLYGGGAADDLVCPLMISNTLVIGTLRMVADKHWLSDTVPAWVLGGSIGFGLPWLLHYGPHAARKVASPVAGSMLVPWVDGDSFSLQLMGLL
jgi:hypothetical protein